MCQPKPGPRCSNHSKVALDKAQEAYDKAKAEKFILMPQVKYRKKNEAISTRRKKARERLDLARMRYDATPEGITELEGQIKEQSVIAEKAKQNVRRIDPDAPAQGNEEARETIREYDRESRKLKDLEKRHRRGEQRRAFEAKALKHEKNRQEVVKRMDELADAGDLDEFNKLYEQDAREHFLVNPQAQALQPIRIDEGLDKYKGSVVHAHMKMTTTQGGVAEVEVRKTLMGRTIRTEMRYKLTPDTIGEDPDIRDGFGGYTRTDRKPRTQEYETEYSLEEAAHADHQKLIDRDTSFNEDVSLAVDALMFKENEARRNAQRQRCIENYRKKQGSPA